MARTGLHAHRYSWCARDRLARLGRRGTGALAYQPSRSRRPMPPRYAANTANGSRRVRPRLGRRPRVPEGRMSEVDAKRIADAVLGLDGWFESMRTDWPTTGYGGPVVH